MKSPIIMLTLASQALCGPINHLIPREDERNWRDIDCSTGSLTTTQSDPFDLWVDAKASYAWADLYEAYYATDKSMPFSNFMADFFNVRPNVNCGSLENANCEVTINCGQGNDPNAPTNSPAGYMIANSIITLHQKYEAHYSGLLNALNFMNGEIGSFTSIFAPQLSQMKEEKIMMDVLMMAFGALSAGVFNSWLKKVPYFNDHGDRLSILKDITNSFMAQGINIIKDSMSAIDELRVQNTMALYISKIVQTWVDATKLALHKVMEEDPNTLFNTIVNGQLWDIGDKPDALDITDEVRKTLYTFITPYAWTLGYEEVGVFIATSEGIPGTQGDCESYDPAKELTLIYNIDTKYFKSNRFCNANGDVVWLMNIHRSTRDHGDCSPSGSPGVTHCENPTLHQLPGWDELDGSKWGGVDRSQMVSAALRAWRNNGRKNGWASADPSTPDGQEELMDQGLLAAGMVNIPVCSFSEAFGNAWPDKMTDNWPCN